MREENIKQNFAKNLIKLRKSKKLTQLQLAEKLNYSDKSISKWECGETLPDIETFTNIADFFGMSVNDLLSNSNNILQKYNTKNIIISLLGFLLVWLTTCVIYYLLNLFTNFDDIGLVVLYALPISMVELLVFSFIWFNKIAQFVSASMLIWSTAVAFYLLQNISNWFIFIIAIVLEIMCILWFWLKKLIVNSISKKS